MAAAKTETPKTPAAETPKNTVKTYIITVKNNPDFCGIGAGGVQFANGTARTTRARLADWFKERPDVYTVEEKAE
jgi:hypothetical protein